MKSTILLLRPQQWIKNIFIFLPVFFSGRMLDLESVTIIDLILAFIAFSLSASGVYCLNDIIDAEADRKHPQKKLRPIASGAVSRTMAMVICIVCWCIGIILCLLLRQSRYDVILIILSYVLMNIAYSLKLKQYAIIDVFIIAIGFVLRLFCGGVAACIELSHWIVLMTFLLALFLAFAKRRDDVVTYEATGNLPRKNINFYNISFLNQICSILATILIVCYIMYTVSPELMLRLRSRHIYITSIFVIAAIIRYLQLTIVESKSGSPTRILLKDRFIQICLLLWGGSFYALIYL